MNIKIQNCNNIKECNIEIQEGKLNIKYGINGTGKSTISNVIECNIDSNLNIFKPFNSTEDVTPSITYVNGKIKKVKIYNEKYINDFLFISEDSLHINSFEVFAKVPHYDDKIKVINDKLYKIKNGITLNKKIDELILIYNMIDKEIKINRGDKLGNSGVVAALTRGNKIINIPDEVKEYAPFLKKKNKIDWYKWYIKGFDFYTKQCPFCTVENDYLDKKRSRIDSLFIKNDVSHISKTQDLLNELSNYIIDNKKTILMKILANPNSIDEESRKELLSFKKEFIYIYQRLQFLRNISYLSINKIENLEKELIESKIDINNMSYFVSEDIKKIFEEINSNIEEVLINIHAIVKETSILNTEIKAYIKENENKINDFLSSVGMNYQVDITRDTAKLIYINSDIIVEPKTHLSWGEKNCFALALFLFDCLSTKPDLIILDDPVSSFDTNKKYGIIHYLFKGKKSLKDKTVLLFSHDIEPIINFYKKDREIPTNVVAYCLSNHNNIVEEKIIRSDKLRSVLEQCEELANDSKLNVLCRLINCRRIFEIQSNYESAYDILSSLFHNKSKITKLDGTELSEDQINKGKTEIEKYISDFNYDLIRKDFLNYELMKKEYFNAQSSYEKIELFRIINSYFSINGSDNNILKFINETYHIENSFLYQLDPYIYDCVPDYIINACDKMIINHK